ncbi:TPA: FRG domain-containing protein [Pseudomonas aeruginosa]|nr:FRG domain-containing protein [Pseudomonas aeruginosa]HBP0924144.1 FRG domain-containing protein [Pseudomonas aeruginosa]HBP0930097.1 FRG domain-containing protein [Pseudomonas aeruginosa]HBP0930813.1 FRG domain-containing protein [Pseudomonas aeruginosa]HBP1623585.1 FRG domain-containing protein [Pseudomonas aeruginosa]
MTQIINVTKLHQLISDIEASLEERDGPRWFRGCGNFPNHRLEPTLLRHPKIRSGETTPLIVEQNLKNRFRQTSAPFLSNTPTTDFDWLFLQQHYGVPTRLLDWTENPFIALYFALSSSSQTENACVWMLDPIKWNQLALNNPQLDRVPDALMPQATQFLSNPGDDFSPSDPIAIFGNHTNPRITAQRGTFVMFCRSTDPMENKNYAEQCLKCYVINEDFKTNIYEKLLSIGYTHSVVYPDLSGLGTEIKTSYGF